jgi:hypothetical protein
MMPASDDGIMARTIVELPDADRDQLDAHCRLRGISRAQALREALVIWLEHQQPQHRAVFGLWRDRPLDSLAIEKALRTEWSDP